MGENLVAGLLARESVDSKEAQNGAADGDAHENNVLADCQIGGGLEHPGFAAVE